MRMGITFLCIVLVSAAHAGTVELIDLGLPGGATRSYGDSINNLGTVIVRTSGGSSLQPYLRFADGTYTPAGIPPGFTSVKLNQINDLGVSVGRSGGGATIRSAAGVYTFPLGTASPSEAHGLNNLGEVVGSTGTTFADRGGFYFHPSSGVTHISAPPGASAPELLRINNSGLAIGDASVPVGSGNFARGMTWAASMGSVLLPTIGTEPAFATDINDAGFIIGTIGGSGTSVRAVRWNLDGSITELGSPAPSGFVVAEAINNLGDIVGDGLIAGPQAVLWSAGGGSIVLNDLLTPAQRFNWNLSQAFDINDQRQIVGWGKYDPDGPPGPALAHNRGFLLNLPPIPEPTMPLLGLVAILALMHRGIRARHPSD